ncbi:MAG: UDPGP type 1 family protein [Phycisphaerae bacterium]|nr:UDPGP type 1 family protein [Phycisphaerae bacterium]NUQ46402.1 UDPGP type 1 family protein [Phycisphaerae bacterium]
MQSRETTLRELCSRHEQDHVFTFWDRLTPDQRDMLLSDLERVRFEEMPALLRIVAAGTEHPHYDRIEPPVCVRRPVDTRGDERTALGESLLSRSAVAALLVAGGQGTRLGFDGPKGAFRISPVRQKPLFQLFAEQILATDRRYGGRTRWYIMTSEANDAETRAFFEQHRRFGLPLDQISFFKQGSMPAFSLDGRMILESPHRLALSPDGHGGSLLAMATTGVLADMAGRGIEHVGYFQVDNPLVRCLDPFFIGLHAERGSEMSSKTVPKASDDEKVGVFAICDGVLRVLEYSDLPNELAKARQPDGSRRFDAGSIAVHILARTFVERLTADPAAFRLPWHRAVKKVSSVDLRTGQMVQPNAPNAVKLEAFVFDALPLAKNPVILETNRREEFSPVKNATGVDSVETSQRALSDRAARWLESAGVRVPRTAAGEYSGRYEISPLRAMEAAHLREGPPLPREVRGDVYVDAT